MWGHGRYGSLARLWATAQQLGFSHLELNYHVTHQMLAELESATASPDDPPIPISSVHAPCPSGEFGGRALRRIPINSLDNDLQRTVMEHHHQSIDLAARLGAGVVVIHAGSVAPLEEKERRLRGLHALGRARSREYRALWSELVDERQAMKAPYVERTLAALRELAGHAQEHGLRLGLENRYYHFEIPDVEEMALFLDELGPAAGYWHDVGHAENQARLGFVPHQAWLERLGPRMIGTHLHDIDGLKDHRAPGLGSLSWAQVAPHIPAAAIRVLEVNTQFDETQLRRGLTLLQKEGILAPITAFREDS